MEFRQLGKTKMSVSALSVGSWLTFDHIDPEEGLEVLDSAIGWGINFFDDARYDDRTGKAPIKTGYSEVVFGELFKKTEWDRDHILLANKAWLEFYPDESIAEETEGSLVRLGMDVIDLMYSVPPPKDLPMADLVRMMNELIVSGKIRAWGGLNWQAKQIEEAQKIAEDKGYAPFSAVQLPYNLLYRSAVESKEMRQVCSQTGVSIVASYGLFGGLLTNKYASGSAKGRARLPQQQLRQYQQKGVLEKISALAGIARDLSMTPAQLALAFCLKGPHVASVLFGATTEDQIKENIGALDCQDKLDDEVLRKIRTVLRAKKS